MRAATRFGLAGMGGLAGLTAVDQLRGLHGTRPDAVRYLLGVAPNLTAAIAITFVLLCIWSDRNPDADHAATQRSFVWCSLISGLGLIAWEFVQLTTSRLVFDPHDLGATLVGLGVSALLFVWLRPPVPQAG